MDPLSVPAEWTHSQTIAVLQWAGGLSLPVLATLALAVATVRRGSIPLLLKLKVWKFEIQIGGRVNG